MPNGVPILKGRKPMEIRKIARIIPMGSHMNMARVAAGVGRKASLPSWKTSGFGYFSRGIAAELLSCCSLWLTT